MTNKKIPTDDRSEIQLPVKCVPEGGIFFALNNKYIRTNDPVTKRGEISAVQFGTGLCTMWQGNTSVTYYPDTIFVVIDKKKFPFHVVRDTRLPYTYVELSKHTSFEAAHRKYLAELWGGCPVKLVHIMSECYADKHEDK